MDLSLPNGRLILKQCKPRAQRRSQLRVALLRRFSFGSFAFPTPPPCRAAGFGVGRGERSQDRRFARRVSCAACSARGTASAPLRSVASSASPAPRRYHSAPGHCPGPSAAPAASGQGLRRRRALHHQRHAQIVMRLHQVGAAASAAQNAESPRRSGPFPPEQCPRLFLNSAVSGADVQRLRQDAESPHPDFPSTSSAWPRLPSARGVGRVQFSRLAEIRDGFVDLPFMASARPRLL